MANIDKKLKTIAVGAFLWLLVIVYILTYLHFAAENKQAQRELEYLSANWNTSKPTSVWRNSAWSVTSSGSAPCSSNAWSGSSTRGALSERTGEWCNKYLSPAEGARE